MGLLTQLLQSGEEPIAMMGLMVSQWRLYLQILDGLQRRESFATMAKSIGRQPYYLEKLSGDIRKGYTVAKLTRGLCVMHEADVDIKSGRKRPEEALLLATSYLFEGSQNGIQMAVAL
jgi:DNA polymerase-3 subunit delta